MLPLRPGHFPPCSSSPGRQGPACVPQRRRGPLPQLDTLGRRSIVVSRNPSFSAPGAEVVSSLDAALEVAGDVPEVFVIGGTQLFEEAAPRAQRLLMTHIDADFEGDTFFPELDPQEWRAVQREPQAPTPSRPFVAATTPSSSMARARGVT